MAVGTLGSELTPDQLAAIQAATAPSGANPFVTEAAAPGVGPVVVLTRSVTSAEILALFSSPLGLLPATPDTLYWVIGVFSALRAGPTPYTPHGGNLNVGSITPADLPQYTTQPALWLDQPADQAVFWSQYGGGSVGDLAAFVNAPLYLFQETADPTDGDGTLDVTVLYRAIDVS